MKSQFKLVRDTLHKLCEEAGSARFPYFSAEQVATRAGVSRPTAIKHLRYLASCQGYNATGNKHCGLRFRVSPPF